MDQSIDNQMEADRLIASAEAQLRSRIAAGEATTGDRACFEWMKIAGRTIAHDLTGHVEPGRNVDDERRAAFGSRPGADDIRIEAAAHRLEVIRGEIAPRPPRRPAAHQESRTAAPNRRTRAEMLEKATTLMAAATKTIHARNAEIDSLRRQLGLEPTNRNTSAKAQLARAGIDLSDHVKGNASAKGRPSHVELILKQA